MDGQLYKKRFLAIKQEANTWVSAWKDISKYIKPTRGFFGELPNQGRTIDTKTILDSLPGRSARILAAGMTSGLTSPSRPWFKLGLTDTDLMEFDPVKIWLEDVQTRMMGVYSKSNIYGVLHSMYEEIGLFGTSASIILDDFHDMIRGRAFTAGEYYLGTGPDCRVNTFGREYWLTVGQLVKEFGIDKVSDQVKSLFNNNDIDKWVKVNHLIEPNASRIPGMKDNKNMSFRSTYWEEGSGLDMLRQTGFEDFPVLAPRWDVTTSADVYGKGPGWESIGDVKMLQKMQREKLIALDKIVNPPVQKDASVQGEVNTLPGGVTISSATTPNAGVRPSYQINPDLGALENSIMRTQESIQKNFYSDLFLMMAQSDRRQMTAREVVERHEEKLLMLGPVLERLESELLDPIIDRTFNIMMRSNLVPPPPKELQGMDIHVDYISMLAQAQKMVGTTALEQFNNYIGTIYTLNPDIVDLVDFDENATSYGQMLGISPKIIRGKETVATIRKQKQAALAQQQQAQNAQAMAQGAKTMADTPLGQNSALDAALAGITGNQTGAGIPQ
jgi:hypothetical protein